MHSLLVLMFFLFSCTSQPLPETDNFSLTPGLWSGYVNNDIVGMASIHTYVYLYVESVEAGKATGYLFHDFGTMEIDGQQVPQCDAEIFEAVLLKSKDSIKLDCLDDTSNVCVKAELTNKNAELTLVIYSLLKVDIILDNYISDNSDFEMKGCENNTKYLPVAGAIKSNSWNINKKKKKTFSIFHNVE